MKTMKSFGLSVLFLLSVFCGSASADRVILMGNPGVGSTGFEQNGGTVNGPVHITGSLQVDGDTALAGIITVKPGSATAASGFQHTTDFTGANVFSFTQSAATNELTATNIVQDFLAVKPEFLQTGTAGYNVIHVVAAEPTTAGGGGSGAQNLLLLSTAANDFTSEVEKFKVSRTGATTITGANVAGGSETAITINPTLGIMDNNDTWIGINIAPVNADHTGSSNAVNAINFANITGDGQATETVFMIGSGYDYHYFSGANAAVAEFYQNSGTTNFVNTATTIGVIGFQHGGDSTSSVLFYFAPYDAANELIATNIVQDYLQVKSEIKQTSTAGYNGLALRVSETSVGSGAKNLIYASTYAANDANPFASAETVRFTVSNTGIITAGGGATNAATCWKAGGIIGYCSTVVAADGTCTCN